MATKIRLARHGHKDYAFYHIVVADSRSPRDGKIIERIGSFNPNTNPAAVILNFDRALYWVGVGAQPTDTVRTILSNEGVLLMKHLNGGVAKGAFSQEEAQKRFDAWKAQKDAKNGKISAAEADKKAAAAKALLAQEVEKQRVGAKHTKELSDTHATLPNVKNLYQHSQQQRCCSAGYHDKCGRPYLLADRTRAAEQEAGEEQ